MNTIMVIVLKVLFPYGLSLSYIMIHSVIFQNRPTNVSNAGKGVLIPCRVPPLPPRRGLGRATVGHLNFHYLNNDNNRLHQVLLQQEI